MSDDDQKIRKKWKITLPFVLLYEVFALWVVMLTSDNFHLSVAWVLTLISIGIYGLLYYFTYYKIGHRMLFCILIYPLTKITKIQKGPPLFSQYTSTEELVGILIGLALVVGVYGWWYYISIKMIGANKRIKAASKANSVS
jgi:hypothetical protein